MNKFNDFYNSHKDYLIVHKTIKLYKDDYLL